MEIEGKAEMTGRAPESRRNLAAWWLLGLLNNSGEGDEVFVKASRRVRLPCSCGTAAAASAPAAPSVPLHSAPPAYVIMIAGANEISAAAVGLVYLCAVAPALICKAR